MFHRMSKKLCHQSKVLNLYKKIQHPINATASNTFKSQAKQSRYNPTVPQCPTSTKICDTIHKSGNTVQTKCVAVANVLYRTERGSNTCKQKQREKGQSCKQVEERHGFSLAEGPAVDGRISDTSYGRPAEPPRGPC